MVNGAKWRTTATGEQTFVAKDDWNVVGGQIGFGLDANQQGTASSSDHALAREVLALQGNCKSSFLKTKKGPVGKSGLNEADRNKLTNC